MKKATLLRSILIISWIALLQQGCTPERQPPHEETVRTAPSTPVIKYEVKERYPHDITLYTEGLLFHNGQLFESTGAPSHLPQTRSAFGISDLKTGKFEIKGELDKSVYFGEGIVFFGDKLYQLTYQNQVGFIYDAKTFRRIGQFGYPNKEGWGLTTDGKHLIMSDGTYNLTYFDPATLNIVKTVPVLKEGYGLDNINELEYINGFIYANVWMTNNIVKIDPASGEVVGQLNLTQLFDEALKKNMNLAEMNGIAFDSINDRVLVTGKFWPDFFEIRFPH
jgi:glutaminyl-peptide cyclotransferase